MLYDKTVDNSLLEYSDIMTSSVTLGKHPSVIYIGQA